MRLNKSSSFMQKNYAFCFYNHIASKYYLLGLTGLSHRYHDLAILYRSIKYNMEGRYGKSYEGFIDNVIFDLLGKKMKNR